MNSLLGKILSHSENTKVLEFLGINSKSDRVSLLAYEDKKYYTHEGLEDFLEIQAPTDTKFILQNNGIILVPNTGEIIAFQFGRFEKAFKLVNSTSGKSAYGHIKRGLFWRFKFREARKVCFGYFSNVYGDEDTVVDITQLGREWALGIYLIGAEELTVNQYLRSKSA